MSLVSRRAPGTARSSRSTRTTHPARRRFTAGLVVACLASAVAVLSPATTPAASAATATATTADTTAPTWGTVTVSHTALDTSTAPVTINVTARILDDQSGIVSAAPGAGGGNGFLTFRTPGSSQNIWVSFSASQRVSGTAQDGTYRTTVTIPRYSAQGTWSISGATLTDSAGNSRYAYTADELSAAGLTASFSQTGVGDTTPPRFAGLTFTPASIDTSAAARTVTARVRITDDLSGFDSAPTGGGSGSASISLRGPNGSSNLSLYVQPYNRVSGTARDGIYESTVTIPRYSPPGTWDVSTAFLRDTAGNSVSFNVGGDGLEGTFEQTGAGDSTAPALSDVTVTPAEVNTAASTQHVTVRARITDDLAGLSEDPYSSGGGSVSLNFTNTTGSAYATASFYGRNRISGTATDGVYETTMSVAKGATGRFTASSAWLSDAAGNSRYAPGSEFGSPTFDVVGTVSTPSAPLNVTVTPGNGTATVNWAAPARDNGAAITGYRITASTGAHTMLGHIGPCAPMPVTGSDPTAHPDVTVEVDASVLSTTVPGLSNGTAYTFTVSATNSAGWGAPSIPTPKIRPYDPATDTAPPVLRRLEITPAAIDTTDGPATVTVAACITDDLAGLARSYPSSSITLRSPSGRRTVETAIDEFRRIDGSAIDGLYRVTLTIPQYSETGRWSASLTLVDAVGNSASFSAAQLAAAGLPAGIDQTGTVADTTAPVLADLDITPDTIDTTVEPQTITVVARITDDYSGLGGWNRPSLWFRSPSGRQSASATLTLQSGDGRDGVWAATFSVPRYAEAGTWSINGISLSDSIGNSRSFNLDDFAAAGLPTSFTQTGRADTTAPYLAWTGISPASVDTSAGPQTVAISAHVIDDLAGVAPSGYGLSVVLRSPSGRQMAHSSQAIHQSGTTFNGSWSLPVTLPQHAEQGRWRISSVSLSDQLSNYRQMSYEDLVADGMPHSVEQTGAGDSTAPSVRSLTFTPDPVDTSGAGRTVTVQTRLTDDRSGATTLNLQVAPPSGLSPRYVNMMRVSGDGLDGIWEGKLSLPRYAETGTWRVSTLWAYDAASNVATLTAADLRAAGVTTSFSQTGSADTAAPELAELTWTPGSVDTSGAAQTVSVRARFTDDLSGLSTSSYGPYLTVQSFSGRQSASGSLTRVTGTALEATYEGQITVPRYSEAGAWTLKNLALADLAGNVRTLTAASVTAAGFDAGFTQTGTADTEPPALLSVSATPATVDSSYGPANVTVAAHITDALSGMGMYQGTFTFTSRTGNQTLKGYIGYPASGSARDGRYQVNVSVPRYVEWGVWRLTHVELTDMVGNKAELDADDLAAAGLAASFEQTGGTFDVQAPTLADLTITPDAVNVATSAQRITVRARVTDAFAGVAANSAGVRITSPSGNQTLEATFSEWSRTSGSARDGVYEWTLVVPYLAEAGTWTVKVNLADGAGNRDELDATELAELGFTSSLAVAAEVAPSAPAAPWGVTASSGNGAVTVAWKAPADDGGSPITSYRVTARSGGTTVKTVDVDAAGAGAGAGDGVTTVEVDGLTNGVAYSFTVTATNAVGTGPESAPSNTTTPATVPGAPTAVSAVASPSSAKVQWSAPASDGGNPIAHYLVGMRHDGELFATSLVPASETSTDIVGLTNGTSYTFTVTAVNAVGSGPESDASQPVTPLAPPGAPSGVSVIGGNGSATVSWSAPGDDGGTPVLSYTVKAFAGSTVTKTVTVDGPATSVVVDGLSNGTAYRFTVAATNSVGTGGASAQSPSVTPVTTPDAPTNVVASPRDASATVRWTAPAGNGGSSLTGYTVTAYSGDAAVKTVTASKSATQVTVGGLENGVAYRFTVAASNAVGTGAASSPSAEVTPTAAPPSSSTTTTTTTPSTSSTTTTTTAPSSTTTTTTTAPPTTTTTTTPPPVNVGPAKARSGYWMVAADGRVYPFGDALHHGEPRLLLGNAAAVDLEPTKSNNGYWILDDAGRVFAYGDARPFGNVNAARLAAGERATSLSRTVSGNGYWVFTNRGRVLTFGDAVSFGDVSGTPLNGPVLDSIVTPSGKGYYMVASDGGIFAFGDAKFHGSMGGQKLNAPVQSLVPDGDGEGYWLVASDGGIFAFKAPFRGSMGSHRLNRPVSGMVPFGNGYLMVGEDGGIFNFSDRPFLGSLGAAPPARPVTAVAVMEN
jgi:hypothetical protein